MIIHAKDDAEVVEFLKEMSVIMLHIIDAIGRMQPVNGITISKQFVIKGEVFRKLRANLWSLTRSNPNLPRTTKRRYGSHSPPWEAA